MQKLRMLNSHVLVEILPESEEVLLLRGRAIYEHWAELDLWGRRSRICKEGDIVLFALSCGFEYDVNHRVIREADIIAVEVSDEG